MSHAEPSKGAAGGPAAAAGGPAAPAAGTQPQQLKQAQTAAPTLTKLQTVSASPTTTRHVGAAGSEYVANILRSVKPPTDALKRVQETCGLSNPLCQPLLIMLDYLGVPRREAHLTILNRAKEMLLKWIAEVKASCEKRASERGLDEPETQEELILQEKLERLLIASFKYMGVTELKQVCCWCSAHKGCFGGAS